MSVPDFIGVGCGFPIRLNTDGSKSVVSSGEELIKQSIDSILNTRKMERPYLVRQGVLYGTSLKDILFDSADAALATVEYEVKQALDVWEPRIFVDHVSASEAPTGDGGSQVVAVVSFRYRATNRSDNFVVPFLLRRADQ